MGFKDYLTFHYLPLPSLTFINFLILNTLKNRKLSSTKFQSEIISIRFLTESTYILRFYRHGLEFIPGQYIVIGLQDSKQKREYSIYSPVNVNYLEVLIKEVDNGFLSKKLKYGHPGEIVEVEGPFGYFVLDENYIRERKYLFISSGTGISPFHSIILSNPDMDYTLLHGVRYMKEGYESTDYAKGRYIQCTSKEPGGGFQGRVTDYLIKYSTDITKWVYLCGNSAMIDDAYTILEKQGVPSNRIHAEVYF
jgi:ferredoxin--NADP+ reductase/benzoate/toluate 1,2-dioxygenase reductase subunit